MKLIKSAMYLGIITALTAAPAAAQSENSDALCGVYSTMGEVLVEFLLPKTLQQFVDATSGKDPTIMAEFGDIVVTKMTAKELLALGVIGEDDAGLLGEAAGQVAVNLLMTGQATTASEVRLSMSKRCQEIGPQDIIENQRRANAAVNQNMGN